MAIKRVFEQHIVPVLKGRCSNCHNRDTAEGGLDLTTIEANLEDATTFATWVKLHDRVRDGEMPPKDAEQPTIGERDAFLNTLGEQLHSANAARRARDGRALARRLNRDEYQNTLRDLLDVVNEYRILLPEDGTAAGFASPRGVIFAVQEAEPLRRCIPRRSLGTREKLRPGNDRTIDLQTERTHIMNDRPMLSNKLRHLKYTLAFLLATIQTSINFGQEEPLPGRIPNASAPSYVLQRGDLEILTYETEQDYDRLQTLFQESEKSAPAPGELTVRYYRSPIDDSVQPYSIWLPQDYSREQKYAVVVQLHGTNFKEVLSGSRLRPRGMGASQWVIPQLPVIYVHCTGGPTTFYQGIGEVDILSVIEEVKRLHSIDPDRVFIMGHSMGGAGSYTVGLHQPDHFGGIMAFDPAMGNKAAVVQSGLPEWMQPQIDIVTPSKLYSNARNVDVFFKNAGAGIQRNNTEYSDGIVAQGGFATTEVLPGLPHSFGSMYPNANWVTELIAHPIRRRPAEVKFYTNTLQYNRAYWVTLDRLTQHNADAIVTATCNESRVSVTTNNIDAFTLRLDEAPTPKGSSAKLLIDGRELLSGPLPAIVHLHRTSGDWQVGEVPATGLAKRHGLQGPIGDAFNSRFLAVYGKDDRDLAISELDAIRNPPGPFDIHGDFPMKVAEKVTSQDIQTSNLILFGTPESNVVLKRIASSLPSESLNQSGVFIYPNPENPNRYVVVWNTRVLSLPKHGLSAGWIMPLNLLPDYVQVNDGKIVSGGFFSNEWKFAPPKNSPSQPVNQANANPSIAATNEAAPRPVQPSLNVEQRTQQGNIPFARAQEQLLTDDQRQTQRQALDPDETARIVERIRQVEVVLKELLLAQPLDATALQVQVEALSKLQAEQTVLRLKTFTSIATTLSDDQRERIKNAPPGSLSFSLTNFATPNGGQTGAGGGRFQGGQPNAAQRQQGSQRPFGGKQQPDR